MTSESPVSHLKISGFGAFQQCAIFFHYDCVNLLAKNLLPLQEDEEEFLQKMEVMFVLFDMKYTRNTQLPDTLALEKEAWQLLRLLIQQWIQKYSALLEQGGNYLTERKTLIMELQQLLEKWRIISSSFKQKLEALSANEKDIRELIESLRAEASTAVKCLGGAYEI